MIEPSVVERLLVAYHKHEKGEILSHDRLWLDIQKDITRHTRQTVIRVTRSRDFHGLPLEEKIEEVSAAVLRKFLSKKFKGENVKSFASGLTIAAHNELLGAFRRSRSPCTIGYEGVADNVWANQAAAGQINQDLFGAIRSSLEPFRFPEATHVREAILSFFLQTQRLPGQQFLSSFRVSPQGIRVAVYNAAVFDINSAILGYFSCNQ